MQRKLLIAGALATIGIVLAGSALWPVLFSPAHAPVPVDPVLSPAAAGLGAHLLDTDPSVVGAPAAIERAIATASRKMRRVSDRLSARASQDLLAAFRERLQATINPNYERNLANSIARGQSPREASITDEALERWIAHHDLTRDAKLGIEHLEIRWIARDGVAVAQTGLEEGYDVTSFRTGAFGLPSEPGAHGFSVVEVRLPMGLTPRKGDDPGAVLVGYRFAWDNEHRTWVPCANVIYVPPGVAYYPIPF